MHWAERSQGSLGDFRLCLVTKAGMELPHPPVLPFQLGKNELWRALLLLQAGFQRSGPCFGFRQNKRAPRARPEGGIIPTNSPAPLPLSIPGPGPRVRWAGSKLPCLGAGPRLIPAVFPGPALIPVPGPLRYTRIPWLDHPQAAGAGRAGAAPGLLGGLERS